MEWEESAGDGCGRDEDQVCRIDLRRLETEGRSDAALGRSGEVIA
jgi:hypothetical protein